MYPHKIAFIKFGGLSAGGTERWLQGIAANLPKDKFTVDYFYCDSAPYLGSDYCHADTDLERFNYLKKRGVNIIKFSVDYKDITVSTHDWIKTDFWEKFKEENYDLVQSAKAGPGEYPFDRMKKIKIVDSVHLFGVDHTPNIVWTFLLSEWSRNKWVQAGGNLERSSVIHPFVDEPRNGNLRDELGIPEGAVVAGFHQRPDNNIFSEIPLKAFSKFKNGNFHFIILGGGDFYKIQANDLKLKNIHFIEFNSNPAKISMFLNTIDIFAHGRRDGETFGTVFAEAVVHGKPCLSHYSSVANAQKETMGSAGLFAQDLDEYITMLNQLYTDQNLRSELSGNAKQLAQKYKINQNISNVVEVYEKVISENFPFAPIIKVEQSRAIVWLKIIFLNPSCIRIYKKLRNIFKQFWGI